MHRERLILTAGKAVLAGAIAFATLSVATARVPAAADPMDLYQRATGRLTEGDLVGAAAHIGELRTLIARTPEWDPDDTFTALLLPELEEQLIRIGAALEGLENWAGTRLDDVRPPDPAADADILPAFTGWASGTIKRVHTEAAERVDAELSDPDTGSILKRTERYETVRRRLEAGVLVRMSEGIQKEMDRILSADERSDALQTRLESVKRSTIDLAVERDRQDREIDRYREQAEQYRLEIDRLVDVLADLIGEGTGPQIVDAADPVGVAFGSLLERQIGQVEARHAQTAAEKSKWRRNLGRYRHYNQILTGADLSTDQAARITALETAVEAAPTAGFEPVPDPPSLTRYLWLPLAVLSFSAALLGWLAARFWRSRQPAPQPIRRSEPADRGNDWR